jgi:excisionase family DNA binding protein
MNLKDLPPTISVERAGEILGISRRSAYRAAAREEIPTLRVGRRLLVPTHRLLAMLGQSPESTPVEPASMSTS